MASAQDVFLACQVLSQRRLEECRKMHKPAYINCTGSTPCSIADTAAKAVCSELEVSPAWIPEWDSNAHMLPPGLDVQEQAQQFMLPASPCHQGSFKAPAPVAPRRGRFAAPSPAELAMAHAGAVLRAPMLGQEFTPRSDMRAVGGQPCRRARRRCHLRIAEALCKLQGEDAACVIYVCNIHRLGFASAQILREHFEQYGLVKSVFLSNSHEYSSDDPHPQRIRPSRIGFVLMQHPEDAAAVLAAGDTQIIRQHSVSIRKFETRSWEEKAEDNSHFSTFDLMDETSLGEKDGSSRGRTTSTASTASSHGKMDRTMSMGSSCESPVEADPEEVAGAEA